MKLQKLALLTALLLCLAPLSSAQRSGRSYTSHRSGITVNANLGRVGVSLGFGRRPSIYSRSSRYVSPKYCAPSRIWVEGHYRTDYQKVFVQTSQEKRWISAQYETRYDSCGRAIRVLVQGGYWTLVTVPAHYEKRAVQTWVPGRFELRR